MKTTLTKMMKQIVAEEHFNVREFECDGAYHFVGNWNCRCGNGVRAFIAVYNNERIKIDFTYIDYLVPDEKVNDVLRFFSYLNEHALYSKYAIDFEHDNEIDCFTTLIFGEEDDFIQSKYYKKIKDLFLKMLQFGFEEMERSYSYIEQIIEDDEDPDEVIKEHLRNYL